MKTVNLVLSILVVGSLSGCHWFGGGAAKSSSQGAIGEARKVASSPEGQQLFTEYDKEILTGKCSDQVQEKIKLYGAERSWVKGPPGLDGSVTYVSPTRVIGQWAGVKKYQSGELQFLLITRNRMRAFDYGPQCGATIDPREAPFAGTQLAEDGGPVFTDDDLLHTIERESVYGIIYVWSPGMVYSYSASLNQQGAVNSGAEPRSSGIKNAREAALKAAQKVGVGGGGTLAIVDPAAPRSLIKRVYDAGNHDLSSSDLRKMDSLEMMMRSMGQHFPAILVYGNGKIYRQIRFGVASEEKYQQFIEEAYEALRK